MRHGRRRMLLAAAVLASAGLGAYQVWGQPDGATAESREALLAEALPAGHGWNLVSELELEGYLIGGAATEYAEITYTVDGEMLESCRYETGKMPVLCHPAPADRYGISVVYYDHAGNRYT